MLTRLKALLTWYLFVAVVLFICLVGIKHGCRESSVPFGTVSVPLPRQDLAEISYKDDKLTVVTAKKQSTQYIPDHATVEIQKNGDIVTHVQQVGWEHRPYIGVSVGEGPRIQAGVQLVYIHKAELGAGFGLSLLNAVSWRDTVRLNINISYVVYRHTSVFVGVDHLGMLLGGIQVRL